MAYKNNVKFRALVVDDEPAVLKTICDLLEMEGVACVPSSNGESALKLSTKFKFDIVITDLRMPKMHGIDLIDRLLKKNPILPIVVLTGLGNPEIVYQIMTKGVKTVIIKPFDARFFNSVVMGIIVRSHLEGLQSERLSLEPQMHTESARARSGDPNLESLETPKPAEELVAELSGRLSTLNRDFILMLRNIMNKIDLNVIGVPGHAELTEQWAVNIGQEMDLPEEDIRDLSVAALLHDIGKVELPPEIRNPNPDAMTKLETYKFEQHPVQGAEMIGQVPGMSKIADTVRDHHERFNGLGYPGAKSGKNLSRASEIICIANDIANFIEKSEKNKKPDWNKFRNHLIAGSGTRYSKDLVLTAAILLNELELGLGDLKKATMEIKDLKPGQLLAEDVHSASGTLLLRQGVVLTPQAVSRLRIEFKQNDQMGPVRIYLKKDTGENRTDEKREAASK